MRQIHEFRSNFENISRDCRAIVTRLSHDSRATFVRVSHNFPANVSYFHFNSYDSRARTTFVRMSLCFIFSPDSREFFACCLKTVARPSCDTRTTFVRMSRKFRIVNSPKFRGDRFANVARPSHDSHATVLRNILGKKFASNFQTCLKPSRPVRD